MTIATATDHAFRVDKESYRQHIGQLTTKYLRKFRRLLLGHALVHTLFTLLGLAEGITLIVAFPTLVKSTLLAVCLATLFVTLFSYFSVRIYLQTKKPQQLTNLKEAYRTEVHRLISYQEGITDHHLALAAAVSRFASDLKGGEYSTFTPPKWLNALAPALERLSTWCYWQDFLTLRELLLQEAVAEQIKLVQKEPTNLEVHAALANAYVTLSSLYLNLDELHDKFRATATRAIEEFKILSAYAPDDPWVHAQLAYSYRDLQMPEEEIHEYEMIMQLRPDDLDTLFKLGMRYFQSGQNAKGLRVYQQLKHHHHKKADDLLQFYGTL